MSHLSFLFEYHSRERNMYKSNVMLIQIFIFHFHWNYQNAFAQNLSYEEGKIT